MKYFIISAMFLAGSEIVSFLALSIMGVCFLADIVTAKEEHKW